MRYLIILLIILSCTQSYEEGYSKFYTSSFASEVDSIKEPPLNPIFKTQNYKIWLDSIKIDIPFIIYTPLIEKLEIGDSLFKDENTWNVTVKKFDGNRWLSYYYSEKGWHKINEKK